MHKKLKKTRPIFEGIADRVFSVLGAIGIAQFPQYFSYYLQRLGGHLSEARQIVAQYRQAADSLGISLEKYIETHLDAENEIFISSGEIMGNFLVRLESLEQSFYVLQQSTPFNRWWVFFQEVDWAIARQTLNIYTPGIPTTPEGLIYAFLGLIIGWGLFSIIKLTLINLFFYIKKNVSSVQTEDEKISS